MLAVDGHKKSAGTLLLACAILGALAAVLFGLSPAQAHTNTAFAFPVTNGFYTAWDGDVARINETGTPNCSPGSSLVEATSNDRESFDLDLSTVPNGATVTGVNVTTNHRSDSTAGGTFQTFLRVNGTDVDNGSDIITQTASGSACGLQTSQFLPVTPFVKAAGTDLEIGVLKSDTNTAAVRVGLIRVAVRYNRAPSAPSLSSPANASTTNDRTPAFDWNDDSVDPDGSDGPLTYEINRAALVSGTCDWPNGTINAVSASTFTPGSNMSFGTHCWRVRTLDHDGLAGAYSTHRTITIQQSDVSAVITAADKVYDGDTDAEYTCDVVGEQSGDNVTCDGTHPATFDTATAGTGKTVTATGLTLSGADAGNYNLTNTTDEDTADIEKKTLSVNAVNNSKTYGEDDPTFAYTVTGFVSGENAMNAAGFGGSASCTRAPGNDVGTYTITCAPGTLTATNYSFTTGTTGTLTIDKADPNCSIDGFTGPYDGDSHGATGSCSGVDDEELDGLDLGDSFTNVPGGTANWTFTDETGNYNDDSGSVEITINKADPNCSIDGFNGTYDGDPHGASGTCAGVNGEGPLDGLDLGDSFTNVPGGTANWSFTDETGNYTDDSGAVSIVITEAAPTCSIEGFTGPYDGDSHGASGSCTGVDDEELAGLDLGETYTDVPGGTANWTFTSQSVNYNDDSGAVEITINKVDPTCTIEGFTGPYDGNSHGATGSCTGVNDEELAGLDLGETYTDVPGGTANWSFTSQSVNYNDDSGAVEITINKADATCSIDGFTGPYDGESHGATGSCTGINDEELTGLDLGDSFTNAPGGTANWTFTDETGNYTDDSGAVSIVINEAAPTCTIDGFTGPYDGDPHGAAGSCTGVNDEELAGLDLGDSFTNAPGGIANWSFVDETGNYSDDSGSVEIVITSIEVSAEIAAQDKPYDGLVDADYTCDVVGELDGADVDCDGAHPAMFEDANVGTDKEVTATELVLTGGDAGNYTLINLTDTDEANITAATLAVNADNKTKEFGDDDPLLTYTLTGFIAPDDAENVTITGAGECTREAGESVADSPYEINCTPGNLEADNYTFVTGSVGEFTITPDTTVPSVTIDQALSQDDPTTDSPIVFDVVFSEDVTGFEDDDVELSGSAGATTANVTGDGAEYTVSVSGMTSNGDVIADVKAAAATDGSNDSTASTSDDNTVTYNLKEFDPGPTATISGSPRVGETLTAGEGSPLPAPDSFEYEWFADGSPISGADDPTFTPTTAEVGKAITVTVTAVKAGYADASDTSDPTSPVGTLGPKTLLVKAQPVAFAGDRITIRVARLAPRENYTIRFDGEVIKTGKANAGGSVGITFLLPLSTQPSEYTVTAVGSLPDRTGTDMQSVRAPLNLGVTLTKPSVQAGGTQRVQVRNLLHGESVEVRYDGILVSPSSAKGNSSGGYALTFPVGTTVGSHTVEVKGLYDGRTTTKTFEVTGP